MEIAIVRRNKLPEQVGSLEGSRMRLKRISLFAMLSLVLASGCSASRNAITPLRDRDDHDALPPRHDHEYSPGTEDSEDFQNPPESNGPLEPVPAPPAFGVSRVKSVGWIKDLGAKFHRKPVAPPSECADELSCADQKLVGKCSALDPCVTESECVTESPEACCEERACDSTPPRRTSKFKRFHRSLPGAFPHAEPHAYKPECSPLGGMPEACGTLTREVPAPACGVPCGEPAVRPGCAAPGCGTIDDRAILHSERERECLADPLRDTMIDNTDPGLITPADIEAGHGGGADVFNGIPVIPHSPREVFVPEQINNPPVQGAPVIPPQQPVPAAPGSSTRIVEPPVWPGLRNKSGVTSVSRSTVLSSSAATKIAGDLPVVIPAAKK
ncbi:MAG: hypothetical protein DWI00_03510 [Planctomycetota bacterium]|nr:MAG: hypothetical protein DWI00_03510 [Planctomycetota bacterium]